jgi:hypothetical protein
MPVPIPAFVIAVLAGSIAWSLQTIVDRRAARPSAGSWGAALGLAVGFLAAFFALKGWPPFPPIDVADWLPYLAVLAMVLGLVEGLARVPDWSRWLLRATLAALLVWVKINPLREPRGWGALATAAYGVGLWTAALFLWWNLESVASRVTGAAVPLALSVLSLAVGIVSVGSHVATAGLMIVGLAVASAAIAIVCLVAPAASIARGGVGVATILLFGVGLDAYFYGQDMPVSCAALLTLAPIVLWVGWIPPLRCRARWQAAFICALAILIPAGAAAGIALTRYLAESVEESY